MSLLGPLWAWLFITLPLAMLTASLWWGVRQLPEPLPLDEYERRLRSQHPEIGRRQVREFLGGTNDYHVHGLATSASSAVFLPRR